jgi:hypothetical protein
MSFAISQQSESVCSGFETVEIATMKNIATKGGFFK